MPMPIDALVEKPTVADSLSKPFYELLIRRTNDGDKASNIFAQFLPVFNAMEELVDQAVESEDRKAFQEGFAPPYECLECIHQVPQNPEDMALEKERVDEVISADVGVYMTKRVEYILNTLTPNQGLIVVMRDLFYMEMDEISQRLHKKKRTAEQLYRRGIIALDEGQSV